MTQSEAGFNQQQIMQDLAVLFAIMNKVIKQFTSKGEKLTVSSSAGLGLSDSFELSGELLKGILFVRQLM